MNLWCVHVEENGRYKYTGTYFYQHITRLSEVDFPRDLSLFALSFDCRSLSTAQLPLKNLNDPASQQSNLAIEGVQRALEKAELDAKRLGRITKEDVLNIVEQIKQQSKLGVTSKPYIVLKNYHPISYI